MRLISENPARDIKPIKCQKRIPFFFSDEQLGMIFNSDEPAYYKKLYLFLLLTGMRACVICNLWHEDIDLERRRIFIREKPDWKPKTGERVIPISKELAKLISLIKRVDERYVFVNERGHKLTVHALDKRFIRLRNSIGLEKGSLHTFRHTYGAKITMNTGNIRALQMILGHQKIETTQIYSHLVDENLKKVTDQEKIGIATILATMKKRKPLKRRLSC
jgi:integrase/recombinase XerD